MPLVIISADKEIIELVQESERFNLIGVFDLNPDADALDLPVLGPDQMWSELCAKYPDLKAVLALDDPDKKKRVAYHYGLDNLVTLVSCDAYISASAVVKQGCLVQRGVKIMANAQIGIGCKINVNVTVHHDISVGDFCTLAPGCQLLGSATIEDCVFIGAGAIVLPKVRVGKNSIIGAGAVVLNDVPSNTTVVGVPARSTEK